ncbi:MAG: hypothetical protein KDK10_06990 [Maritimibacter sp.]|nr:hypothetical protein [Maritimibacter sp.]
MSYHWRRSGRRPAVLGGLGLALVLLAVGWAYGAPWYILALWGSATLGLAALVWTNPLAEVRLEAERLFATDGAQRVEIARARIAAVEVASWTDGPDRWTVTLEDGSSVALPDWASPPRVDFAAALRAAGIPLTER